MNSTTPTADWQPMPSEAREIYRQEGCSVLLSRWREPYRTMIEAGQIEVRFRAVSSKCDVNNRYWWRLPGGSQPRLFGGAA